MDYVALCIVWHLGDQEDNIIENYRIGDLVHNMANIIDVTPPGQHRDLYGQTILYSTQANHLLSGSPCYHGTLNLVIVIIHALASSGVIKQRIIKFAN